MFMNTLMYYADRQYIKYHNQSFTAQYWHAEISAHPILLVQMNL